MAKHENTKEQRQAEGDKQRHFSKKENYLSPDKLIEPGEDLIPLLDTSFRPSLDKHAEWLTVIQNDEQRATIANQLQRTYGNAYVQRLIESRVVQTKLPISQPNDVYEGETDKVESTIIQKPTSNVRRQLTDGKEPVMEASVIQRDVPEATTTTGTTATTETPTEEAEAPAPTVESAVSIWTNEVIIPLTQAHTILGEPDITQDRIREAYQAVQSARNSVAETLRPLVGVGEGGMRIHWLVGQLQTAMAGLMTHMGEPMTINYIRGFIDPTREGIRVMPNFF